MKNLLHAEWIKFRSVRSTVLTLLLAGAIVVLVAVLTALNGDTGTSTVCEEVDPAVATTTVVPDPDCGPGFVAVATEVETNLTGLTGGVTFAALIFGVLGVQAIGQEYRFNTIRPTFTAEPRRIRVMVAKLVVVVVACCAIAAVMVAFCALVGSTMAERFTIDGVDRRVAWGIVVFTALWTMAGVGVGAIVRQPIAGILIVVGESLILETIIAGIFPGTAEWLPFSNGVQMTLRLDEASSDLQPVLGGGIYFGLWCAALFAVGTALVHRRDA